MSTNKYTKDEEKVIIDATIKYGCKLMSYVLDDLPKLNNFSAMSTEDKIKHIMNIEEYSKFVKAYPIVVRYMVEFKTFKVKSFKKYIKHLINTSPSEDEKKEMLGRPDKKFEWLNKQKAIYVKWLYLESSGSHNMKDANRMYNEVLHSLNNDSKKLYNVFEKQMNEENVKKHELSSLMKEQLINQYKNEMHMQNMNT